jgi:D-serine deaminase-like pyridoxal phosphate-dependent protein
VSPQARTSQPIPPAPVPEFALPSGLSTPALVVDEGRLVTNISSAQAQFDRRGIALRPHAKTHKSIRVAKLQLDAGARGITVGTLGEAEVFLAGGVDDLFLAYPVWAEGPRVERIRQLHDATPRFAIGVDSAAGAERLGAAIRGSRGRLRVVVEVDPGNRRTGVAGPQEAVDVAIAAQAAGLVVDGVFSHGGHSYAPGAGPGAGADEVRTLGDAVTAIRDAGFEAPIVSAGSTPTMTAAAGGLVNEVRPGTYVFSDRQQWLLGSMPGEGCAAVVAATVVSVRDGWLVVDAGAKALTKDRADWLVGYGHLPRYPSLVIERLADYHGNVPTPGSATRPQLGEIVAIVPNHICPVVDLVEAFTVVRGDGSTERWPVDARGRSG